MGRPEGAFLIGEVGCGTLRRRRKILSLLRVLPRAPVAEPSEILEFIEKRRLMGRGIGLVDVHLLAAALLSRALLWTHDRRLGKVAGDLEISFSLHFSSRLVTNTRVTTLVSRGGRAGLTRRATEAPAGVLVQYVEEAAEAQRSQDGSFLHFAQVKATPMQ